MTDIEKAIEDLRKARAKLTFNKNSATWPNDKLFAVNTNTSKKITLQLNTCQTSKVSEQKNNRTF